MRRLHILVEGQTEETIADRVIRPRIEDMGWSVSISVLTTKRPASGGHFHGGVSSWAKLEREIQLLLRANFDVLTTLIDYYAFPLNAPGMSTRPHGNPYAAVEHVEASLRAAVGDPAFRPHLVLHETEAWVFAAASHLGSLLDDEALAAKLLAASERAGGPELINDGPMTAPSKRLLDLIPHYQKTLHGPLVVEELGVKKLEERCPHFAAWLSSFA